MTDYEKNSPPNYDEPAPPETLRSGSGFLRVAGILLATLIGILIGVGSTLAWQIYGDQLRALLPQPQQNASQRRNIASDLEDMKKTIQQLEGSDQRLTQTISWLQSSQQEIQRALFLRQTEIRQLSDEMAFLRSKFENAEKLAPAPAPGSAGNKQISRKRNPPTTTPSAGESLSQPSDAGTPLPLTQPSVDR